MILPMNLNFVVAIGIAALSRWRENTLRVGGLRGGHVA